MQDPRLPDPRLPEGSMWMDPRLPEGSLFSNPALLFFHADSMRPQPPEGPMMRASNHPSIRNAAIRNRRLLRRATRAARAPYFRERLNWLRMALFQSCSTGVTSWVLDLFPSGTNQHRHLLGFWQYMDIGREADSWREMYYLHTQLHLLCLLALDVDMDIQEELPFTFDVHPLAPVSST